MHKSARMCRLQKFNHYVQKNKPVKSGEKVAIEVTLKPYRGEEFTKTVYFKVPKDHPGGQLALNVRGGSSMAWVMNLLRKQRMREYRHRKKILVVP